MRVVERLETAYETPYIFNVASTWPLYPFNIFKQWIDIMEFKGNVTTSPHLRGRQVGVRLAGAGVVQNRLPEGQVPVQLCGKVEGLRRRSTSDWSQTTQLE